MFYAIKIVGSRNYLADVARGADHSYTTCEREDLRADRRGFPTREAAEAALIAARAKVDAKGLRMRGGGRIRLAAVVVEIH